MCAIGDDQRDSCGVGLGNNLEDWVWFRDLGVF